MEALWLHETWDYIKTTKMDLKQKSLSFLAFDARTRIQCFQTFEVARENARIIRKISVKEPGKCNELHY